MAEQLGLNLPSRAAMGRDSFLIAPPNQIAIAMIDNWPNWLGGKLVLTGPRGAGKTHLTHVWQAMSGAHIIPAADLEHADIPQLAATHIAVEDVAAIADVPAAQTALFHLHNLTLAEGNSILFTGVGPPSTWGLTLPDLASRIGACPVASLELPDDALLSMVLLKLFSDIQITPKPEVISFLVRRMDRSFSAAQDIVGLLDRASLAAQRPITRSFAASVLDKSS